MKIFSSHRRKLEPKRRFGGREFKNKVKSAANYKRVFSVNSISTSLKFWRFIGIVILAVVVYYLTISSRFVVTDIMVSGNHDVSTQQIQDAIASAGRARLILVKKNNFFILTQGSINDILTHTLPNIKAVVAYRRIWPNKAELTVKERTPGFVIKSNGKYFLIDDEGTVVSQIDDPKNFLVVQDQLVEDFASGEEMPNTKLAPFVLGMVKQWTSKVVSPISLVKFLGKGGNDVQFDTGEGWSVLFDTNRSVAVQLNDLAVILNKEIAAKDRTNLAYIDLRLSKWAYYCFKATPCQQQPQPAENTNVPK